MKKKKKYYYQIDHYECPVCGKEEIYKSRVYNKKDKGHNYFDDYDYCDQ